MWERGSMWLLVDSVIDRFLVDICIVIRFGVRVAVVTQGERHLPFVELTIALTASQAHGLALRHAVQETAHLAATALSDEDPAVTLRALQLVSVAGREDDAV